MAALIADSETGENIGIILDTGATRSITSNRAMLRDVTQEGVDIIQLDGSRIHAKATGTLFFDTLASNGEVITVEVQGALLVKEASATLVS